MEQTHHYSDLYVRKPSQQWGIRVRTGLTGGACVDVNDQVVAALQTLTNALGGATSTTVTAPAVSTATTASTATTG